MSEKITLRKDKGTALTYEELDSNFENYLEFKAKFATNNSDGTTSFPNFTGSNDGKFLFWDNSAGTVGVKALSTSDLSSGFSSNFDSLLASKTTDDLPEGSNVFFTAARWDARLAAKDTDNLNEGSTNQYFTTARADARVNAGFSAKSTDDLSEGSTNKYYTDGRVDARFNTRLLTSLADVESVTSADDGRILYYDHSSTSFKWKADVGAPTLTNLTDVDSITSADDGKVLYYHHSSNSFKWKELVQNTDNLVEGSVNFYYTDARVSNRLDGNTRITLPSYTTTARDALTSVDNGEMIYNTTVNQIQGWQNGAWVNVATQYQ
tara:strand:+ start:122 stop:1087 length:966 start_codon:yes stop_codon:yes gene_type:complete